MIVFLVSGMWHGANWTFILWGLLHGVFSIFDRIIEKIPKKIFEPTRWLATFAVVNILWLLFRADSVQQWMNILSKITSFSNTIVSDGLLNIFEIQESTVIFNTFPAIAKLNNSIRGFMMLMFLLVSSVLCFIPENNYKNLKKLSAVGMIFAALAIVWGITCLGVESTFVYFNF